MVCHLAKPQKTVYIDKVELNLNKSYENLGGCQIKER
jgi:hypothetical protein